MVANIFHKTYSDYFIKATVSLLHASTAFVSFQDQIANGRVYLYFILKCTLK